ncbi:inositol polyphosphate phosphatase [Stylonychia lemnae]|uniref:phosphoinositide 5-phosphatase n=1 Tax=Stylonychia lemnae TaxID=5949 RepID=A0A078A0Q2_STYLE|nr:inositol polyphosphate phosphatase [Stylonychia lemnae]|eukprot:CDW75781.1 inositol polyphosphate phosphatase [Stylonychia lemnae]
MEDNTQTYNKMTQQSQDPYFTIINYTDCFKVIRLKFHLEFLQIFNETIGGEPIIFRRNDTGEKIAQVLVIDKKSCKIFEKDYEYQDQMDVRQMTINGVIGIINIMGYNYLGLIKEREYVGQMSGSNIYKIKDSILIPFQDSNILIGNNQGKKNQLNNYIISCQKLLNSGFFFSYGCDITQSQRSIIKIQQEDSLQQSLRQNWEIDGDKRYIWNYQISQDFRHHRVNSKWIVPIIQGYVGYHLFAQIQPKLELLLISRRAQYNAGTKAYNTGLNDEGDCANSSSKDYNESLFLSLLTRQDHWENQLKIGIEDLFDLARDDKIKNVHYDFKAELINDIQGTFQIENLGSENQYIVTVFQRLWEINGKELSFQFGLRKPQLKLTVKQAKKGILNKLKKMKKGVNNYFNSNYQDQLVHESLKNLTNSHPKQKHYGMQLLIDRQINRQISSFTKVQELNLLMFTWNCAGKAPHHKLDLNNLILPDDKANLPDLIVIGLQEIVKLNAKSVIAGKNKERNQMWIDLIQKNLQVSGNYSLLQTRSMVGCFILLFAKSEHKNSIKNIRTSKVKTGFGGNGGNKGCVSIRFHFNESSFVFMNCHLSSNQNKYQQRLDDLKQIKHKLFDQNEKYHDYPIRAHDYTFILGDLNFRIDMPLDDVKANIEQCNYAELWQYDQLLVAKQSDPILMGYSEGELNFNPTYKYDDDCDVYDTSKKQRIPAWCDRVLYQKPHNAHSYIQLMHYGRKESYFSDHRPVFALFKIHTFTSDQGLRTRLEESIIDQILSSEYIPKQLQSSAIENKPVEYFNFNELTETQQVDQNVQEYFDFNEPEDNDEEEKDEEEEDTQAIDDLIRGKPFDIQKYEQDYQTYQQNNQSSDLISFEDFIQNHKEQKIENKGEYFSFQTNDQNNPIKIDESELDMSSMSQPSLFKTQSHQVNIRQQDLLEYDENGLVKSNKKVINHQIQNKPKNSINEIRRKTVVFKPEDLELLGPKKEEFFEFE